MDGAEGLLPTVDSDGDGLLDTALTTVDGDLVLRTDLDGDGLADSEVRISETAEADAALLTEVEEPGIAAAAAGRILQADWDGPWDEAGRVDPVVVDPDTGRWTNL